MSNKKPAKKVISKKDLNTRGRPQYDPSEVQSTKVNLKETKGRIPNHSENYGGVIKLRKDSHNPSAETKTTHSEWWIDESYEVHDSVFARGTYLKNTWAANYRDVIEHKHRYEDTSSNLFGNNQPWNQRASNDLLSLNITAACVDTLASKMSKSTPDVKYVSNSSDYIIQQRALNLEKFIQGHFKFTKAYDAALEAFTDCLKYGTGFVHHVIRDDKIFYEVVKPFEILVDFLDACGTGNPIDIHIVKLVNRYELAMKYKEHKDKILAANTSNPIYSISQANTDNLTVVESYNRFAKRHTICIENCTLLDEKWELVNKHGEVDFPISIIRFKDSDRNYFGLGLAQELRAIHEQLNWAVQNVQRASYYVSVPKVYVQEGSDIVKSSLNNELGGVITYRGPTRPEGGVLGVVPPDLYQQIAMWWQRGFEVAGISQLTASSQLPAGLQQASGKAMETFYQIESDRFQCVGRRYENLIVDMNDRTVMMMKMLKDQGAPIGDATYYSPDLARSIRWDEIDLERDQYDLQSYPVNQLPSTPEGRLSFVQDLMQTQMLDRSSALKMLRLPDTEDMLNRETAEADFVDMQISQMLRGELVEPDINQDFQFAEKQVKAAFFMYNAKNAEPSGLHALTNYLNSLDRIAITKQAQTQVMMNIAMQQAQAQAQQGQLNPNPAPNSLPSAIPEMSLNNQPQ